MHGIHAPECPFCRSLFLGAFACPPVHSILRMVNPYGWFLLLQKTFFFFYFLYVTPHTDQEPNCIQQHQKKMLRKLEVNINIFTIPSPLNPCLMDKNYTGETQGCYVKVINDLTLVEVQPFLYKFTQRSFIFALKFTIMIKSKD